MVIGENLRDEAVFPEAIASAIEEATITEQLKWMIDFRVTFWWQNKVEFKENSDHGSSIPQDSRTHVNIEGDQELVSG